MAKANENNTPRLFAIEKLKAQMDTPEAIFCGVCAAQGWKAGREVAEDEYVNAVKSFGASPIGRRGR